MEEWKIGRLEIGRWRLTSAKFSLLPALCKTNNKQQTIEKVNSRQQAVASRQQFQAPHTELVEMRFAQ